MINDKDFPAVSIEINHPYLVDCWRGETHSGLTFETAGGLVYVEMTEQSFDELLDTMLEVYNNPEVS